MQTRIEQFEKQLTRYTPEERNKIMEALLWGEELHREQKRASGEPFYIHPMKVAEILVQLEMDYETIIAALLHDVLEDTEGTKKEMQRRFGKEIVALVNGVTKISILRAKSKSVQGAETIRKMLFAMTKDIRVILIKLADKLHNMSTLEYLPEEKRKRIAQECLDIYAPLADRLGISWVKIELEDLALKNLHPLVYTQIKEAMTEKKRKRADYLKKVERTIQQEAHKEGITIEVQSRAKHFFSIYQKMKRRQKGFSEIHDLLGLRILCNTTGECYTLLGLVHKLWPPIEGRFKDYIAMPKSNQYQSLHTTVMCWEGKQLEIQIRTHQMHATAEMGIAAPLVLQTATGKGSYPLRGPGYHQQTEKPQRSGILFFGVSCGNKERASQGHDLRFYPPRGHNRTAQGGHGPGFRLSHSYGSRESLSWSQGRRFHNIPEYGAQEHPGSGYYYQQQCPSPCKLAEICKNRPRPGQDTPLAEPSTTTP